jgi:hypothetical protein
MNPPAPDLVYFFHIPKTAGTSLYDFLNQVPPTRWPRRRSGTTSSAIPA